MHRIVPREHAAAFDRFVTMDDDHMVPLLAALAGATPRLFPGDLAPVVAVEAGLPISEVGQIVHMLTSLACTRTADESTEALVATVCLEEQAHPEGADWARAKRNLVAALTTRAIEVSSKAGLVRDYPQQYLDGRVLSEIRPVFSYDALEPAACLISHQLKLEFLQSEQGQSFYVALDLEDLNSLKCALERAIAKDAKLRSMVAEKMLLPVIE